MRKRLVRAIIFIAVALGVAVGAAGAAGAVGLPGFDGTDSISWGWGGSTTATVTSELAAA